MNCIAVIPARFDSKRLPGKVLLPLGGKTIIQHVWEKVTSASLVERAIVATDDERIFKEVKKFGGHVIMTSPDHLSGTDRVAEVAGGLDARVIVNVQGDEPLISPLTINQTVEPLLEDPSINMSTACVGISGIDELFDVNCVKVILDSEGFAIYFSRLPVPFHRVEGISYDSYRNAIKENPLLLKHFFKHIGIYAYQREFLQIYINLPRSFLEQIEKLEQLRVIENGYKIKVVEVSNDSPSIDTMDDYLKIKERFGV